jgi:molecular chaperone DnaK
MGKAIGIDLGTTNSCAAILEDGKPRVITYRGGSTIIPSVFAIDEQGRRLVGQEAKKQAQLNPQGTVVGAKRLIGRNFHSKTIEKIRQVFTYELVEGTSSEVLIKVNDQIFTLEEISAAIISAIRDFAQDALQDTVDEAVITVPAYFNDRQRQAVRAAGKLAGLTVLRVLNEPTAAALAYGMGKTLNQRIAVYDLGGGTFDISVIDIKDRVFEVIATGGDTFLGGVDFDGRIMQWVLEQFLDQTGIDLSWNRVAIQRVREAAEATKVDLSRVATSRIHIPYITRGPEGPLDVDLVLTRDKLEQLTSDLVERTIVTCERIFREAGTTTDKIDEILLVGGQSRMPLVQTCVTDLMGKPPSTGVHPDEAVAIGAAIMAHALASKRPADVTLLDVLPMPIGISTLDGSMHVLFPKNQPLPDLKTRTLTTSKDEQRSVMLRIYQGESRQVAENELLGTFVFSGIRLLPKGQVQIDVTFHIDAEGILNLTAKDKATQATVVSTLQLTEGQPKTRPAQATAGRKTIVQPGKVHPAPAIVSPEKSAQGVPPPLIGGLPASSFAASPVVDKTSAKKSGKTTEQKPTLVPGPVASSKAAPSAKAAGSPTAAAPQKAAASPKAAASSKPGSAGGPVDGSESADSRKPQAASETEKPAESATPQSRVRKIQPAPMYWPEVPAETAPAPRKTDLLSRIAAWFRGLLG